MAHAPLEPGMQALHLAANVGLARVGVNTRQAGAAWQGLATMETPTHAFSNCEVLSRQLLQVLASCLQESLLAATLRRVACCTLGFRFCPQLTYSLPRFR